MKLCKMEVENFKGIKKLVFDMQKNQSNNVYTLVGINESGKTTILEALNYFEYNRDLEFKKINNLIIPSENDIIPISEAYNFNGAIKIKTFFNLTSMDNEKLKLYLKENLNFVLSDNITSINILQEYYYNMSKSENKKIIWNCEFYGKKVGSRKRKDEMLKGIEREKAINFLTELMPNILYFPTTLFEFPNRIYLEENKNKNHVFYTKIISNVLYSVGKDMSIEKHVIERVRSSSSEDKSNLKQLLLLMSKKIKDVISVEWERILNGKKYGISLNCDVDETKGVYIEINIEDTDGYFKMSERSLGFRWFFVFLLLTRFAINNEDTKDVIFLFDEPAANLSQKAQRQLINSLERISEKCSIIYTTHSHYLINTKWLDGAYVVTNEALKDDDSGFTARNTDIKICKYREFINENPSQISYFQPILDVLEYVPNDLELVGDSIIVEGKNDFYTLKYFFDIVLNESMKKIIPGVGASCMEALIGLFIGWGKNFTVLLDSDGEGVRRKQAYIENFGKIVEDKIYVLGDIDENWQGKELEQIIGKEKCYALQKTVYENTEKFNKHLFNRAIQEKLINNEKYEFDNDTIEVFNKINNFLSEKLKVMQP